MRRLTLLMALVLVTAPAVGGCLSNPLDGDGGETTSEDPPSNQNRTENETETEDPGARWEYEDRSGTVEGTNAVVASEGNETEEVEVEEGTRALSLNLSADGGELDVCIRSPSGNGSGNGTYGQADQGAQEGCDEQMTTEDGNASFVTDEPAAGTWKVEMSPAESGAHSIDYELLIGRLVPAEEG